MGLRDYTLSDVIVRDARLFLAVSRRAAPRWCCPGSTRTRRCGTSSRTRSPSSLRCLKMAAGAIDRRKMKKVHGNA